MTTRQPWDYLVVVLDGYKYIAKASLNGAPYPTLGKQELAPFIAVLGADGWELAGSLSLAYVAGTTFPGTLIFKRPA